MAAFAIERLDPQRNQHRRLVWLPRRRRDALRQVQRAIAGRIVGIDPRGDARRARLPIPEAELGEVDARPLFDRLDEILARSEEHTSELQSLMRISYAVFCLKKKKRKKRRTENIQEHNRNSFT